MKKMITWIMVLVMALSLTSFAAAEEAVTLRLWMWDDAQQPAMRAMADEYEASILTSPSKSAARPTFPASTSGFRRPSARPTPPRSSS